MSAKERSSKGTAAALIALTVVLSIIVPGAIQANPLPVQLLITEFSIQPMTEWRIELYLLNEPYLDSYQLQTTFGMWDFREDLDFPDSGFVVLTDSCFIGHVQFDERSGYIRISDFGYIDEIVEYGNDRGSDVPTPFAFQSGSADLAVNEYGLFIIDSYYLDNSPTFGEPNDLTGALGLVQGTVTDSATGMPIEGAVVQSPDLLTSTETNSEGVYELQTISGFPTVTVTASGYRPDTSAILEITLFPESIFLYDVQLARGSGVSNTRVSGKSLPRSFNLSQNYPNPFNPSTSIYYEISEGSSPAERVRLEVFDTRGRRIRTLDDADRSPGRYTVQWDGKDDNGLRVGSGVYLYRMRVGSDQTIRRMVMLK